jgi:hypothetical protein
LRRILLRLRCRSKTIRSSSGRGDAVRSGIRAEKFRHGKLRHRGELLSAVEYGDIEYIRESSAAICAPSACSRWSTPDIRTTRCGR